MSAESVESIAIIGMACRFPGAPSIAQFWNLLREGRHGIGPVPADRWNADALFHEDAKEKGKSNSRVGGFVDNIDRFDAGFFGVSPREATQMDPQQRLLLELAYEAMEDAGINPAQLARTDTAVHVGAMTNDYLRHQLHDGYRRIDVHTGAGSGLCMLANRLSYQFDLCGPSVTVDTACSSSLVAVFQACQSVWSGQSRMAIAAGVNIILDPAFSVFYAQAGLSAADGKCKTFSAAADGIGRGEGAGVVVLKPLRAALADNDRVYAVIRGGAVNQDGRSNGMTQPNRWAQEQLLRSALRHSQIDARALQYVELHGTGTLIGDPIEANALASVLAAPGEREQPCLVGSVKTNLGHLEAAAGIAGLIKLALSIHYGEIPPSLWFDAPNPRIDFDRMPLRVNARHSQWPTSTAQPRIGVVSSFGLGGTNAQLVLQSPPASDRAVHSPVSQHGHWLFISARSEAALRELSAAYVNVMSIARDEDVAAICGATRTRKGIHDFRLSVLGNDAATLRATLESVVAGHSSDAVVQGRYRHAHRRLILAMPAPESLDMPTLAEWLSAFPSTQSAWDEARAALREHGQCELPAHDSLADGVPFPSAGGEARCWLFAAYYAVAKQMLAAFEELDRLVADGVAQLAALCAADAMPLATAARWLSNDFPVAPTHDIPTERYAVTCDFSAGVNCPVNAIRWETAQPSWRERLDRELSRSPASASRTSVVVVALGDDEPVSIADPKLPESGVFIAGKSPQRLFAELALRHAVRWETTAHRAAYVRLPPYPWQRELFWLDREVSNAAPATSIAHGRAQHALLGARVATPVPIWSNVLDARSLPYIPDHRVQGFTVLPGSAYAEIGFAIHREMSGAAAAVLCGIEFHKAMMIDDARAPTMHVAFEQEARRYLVYTQQRSGEWQLHARGEVSGSPPQAAAPMDLPALQARCTQLIEGADHYANMLSRGFQYGPFFQAARRLWLNPNDNDVLAWIEGHESLGGDRDGHLLHPTVFDASLQTLLTPLTARGDTELYIPIGIRKLELYRAHAEGFWCYGKLGPSAAGVVEGEVVLFARDGTVIARAEGVRAQAVTQNARKDESDNADDCLYGYAWEAASQLEAAPLTGHWLVFADEQGEALSLIERMRRAGAKSITTVRLGAALTQIDAHEFRIGAENSDEVLHVLKHAIEEGGGALAGVVYCWGIDRAGGALAAGEVPAQITTAIHLLQALDREAAARSVPLTFVTQCAQRAADDEPLDSILQATLVALARVAANESSRRIRCVDIDRNSATLATLAIEIMTPSSEDEVALRGPNRFAHRLHRTTSQSLQQQNAGSVALTPNATHLITGGCGGFGLELAKWLIAHGAQHLVLVGRSGANTAAAREAIEAMRTRGAHVHVAAVDISLEADVIRLLDQIRREMPPLKGIYHAAAVLDDAPIGRLEPQQIANAMGAKSCGAWLLHRHTRELSLDHFMLFSSIAALVGGPGQASYAMACIYLDALAHHRRALGLPASSINWGALSQVGMAARFGDAEKQLARTGVGSFTPTQAVKLLGRALEWRPVQLGIAKMDWHAWAATYPSWAASPRYTALLERAIGDAGGQSAAAMRETLLQLDETMRSQTVLALLVQVMATVMEATPEDVDVEESLLSLGIDSLMALDLQVAIERDFGVRVSTLELMKGTTLAQLAERLVGTLLDAQPDDAPNEEHTPAPSPAKRSLDQLLANNDVEMLLASIDDLSSDEIDRVLARLA